MELEEAKLRKRWDGWWIHFGVLRIGPFESFELAAEHVDHGIKKGEWRKEGIGDR